MKTSAIITNMERLSTKMFLSVTAGGLLFIIALQSMAGNEFASLARMKNSKAKDSFDLPRQIDLANAVANGDTKKIQTLIQQGADVNYVGRDGMRPVLWAIIKQSLTGLKSLLDNGADANVTVKADNLPRESALTMAAWLKDAGYLEELLKHGANPNAPVAWNQDISRWKNMHDAGLPNPVPLEVRDTAIFMVVVGGYQESISLLMKYGADVNWRDASGNTPIHKAIFRNSYQMALLLYHSGADPKIKNKMDLSSLDTLKKYKDLATYTTDDRKAYKKMVAEFIKDGLLVSEP